MAGLMQPPPAALGAAPPVNLDDIAKKYPALAPHLKNAVAQWGDGPGVMEFYHPSDNENPNKGKITLQFRDRSTPQGQMRDFAAADMLHYLGSPAANGQPVDPNYARLRDEIMRSRTLAQIRADKENYSREQKQFGDVGTFEQYMIRNRSDAYMRGAAFPDINPEWKSYLTPAQAAIGEKARQYLTASAGTVAPLGTQPQSPARAPTMPQGGGLLHPTP